MKTILFDLPIKISTELIKHFPHGTIQPYSDPNKVLKYSQPNDLIIFYNYHYRKILKQLDNTLPNKKISELCTDRINQLLLLDTITSYPTKKEFYKNHSGIITLTPNLMYKVGNEQQGKDKYYFPETKSIKLYRENLIIEELIQGRSIRILFIGNQSFAVEQFSNTLLKNVNTYKEEIITPPKELLEDAIRIKTFLDKNEYFSPTIGLDYIYSENKIGFLELNDMCGIPEQLEETFIKHLKEIISDK